MFFYNLFLYVLFPFVILRLFSKKEFNLSEVSRIKERLGKVNLENSFTEKPIWIHAVSVGEVKVASLLIKEIFQKNPAPFFSYYLPLRETILLMFLIWSRLLILPN